MQCHDHQSFDPSNLCVHRFIRLLLLDQVRVSHLSQQQHTLLVLLFNSMASNDSATQKLAVAVIACTGGPSAGLLTVMEQIGLKSFALVPSNALNIGGGTKEAANCATLATKLLAYKTLPIKFQLPPM